MSDDAAREAKASDTARAVSKGDRRAAKVESAKGARGTKAKADTGAHATRDPERTKARIFEAALTEFARAGFHGASVRAIVHTAGVNERMLYHYFGSKEELYRELLQRAFDEMGRSLLEVLGEVGTDDAERMLYAMVRRQTEVMLSSTTLMRVMLHEVASGFASMPRIDDPDATLSPLTKPVLAKAQRDGILRADVDPWLALTIAAIAAMVWPAAIPMAQKDFDRRLDTPEANAWLADQMTRMVMQGIAGPRSRTALAMRKEAAAATKKRG